MGVRSLVEHPYWQFINDLPSGRSQLEPCKEDTCRCYGAQRTLWAMDLLGFRVNRSLSARKALESRRLRGQRVEGDSSLGIGGFGEPRENKCVPIFFVAFCQGMLGL